MKGTMRSLRVCMEYERIVPKCLNIRIFTTGSTQVKQKTKASTILKIDAEMDKKTGK